MTYSECTDHIGGILGKIDWSDTEDCSLQFNIIGTDNGVFYVDIRDHVADIKTLCCTESYDAESHYDTYNVKIVATAPVLSRLLRKIVDPIYAYTTGKFKMMGDAALGRKVLIKLCEAFFGSDGAESDKV